MDDKGKYTDEEVSQMLLERYDTFSSFSNSLTLALTQGSYKTGLLDLAQY